MIVQQAKEIARQWVLEEAAKLPDFCGAFFSGSTAAMADNTMLPASSDVDVEIVLDSDIIPVSPRKFVFHGLILEVSYAPLERVRSPESVLGNYFTAIHFIYPSIIADPFGHLAVIQPTVAQEYSRRVWVRKRCEHAREEFTISLTWLDGTAPIHKQVIRWLYALLILTHVVLVADLRNPTVRKSVIVVGDVLTKYGHPELHERLLGILGSAMMQRAQVGVLLASCDKAFDAAQPVHKTRFMYDANILGISRPMAIDGTWDLIAGGSHREVMFWIAAIHTWCQTALHNDAPPDVLSRFTPAYQNLLTQLGISGPSAVAQRTELLGELLPDVWSVVEEILVANPAIVD